ncbi:hypothetical protein BJX68DRAFT_264470 [Aspergillus pseudodeflectus]|uniref:Ankyrin repeat-containing domain protein n=1 Tax=Aspergillus pseudodeflectus TaxID=176178 RepID=A0ABR4KQL1_9EURO
MNASILYDQLTDYDSDIPDPSFNGDSVYNCVEGDLTAMELLYEAGFVDLNQCNDDGLTALMSIDTLNWSYGPFHIRGDNPGDAHWGKLGYLAAWMVSKGANLHQYSGDGYRAIWYLAEEIASAFSCRGWWTGNSMDQAEVRSDLHRQHPDSRGLLYTLLADDSIDGCLCACSETGCTTWTRILRAWDPEASSNHKSLLVVLLDECQNISPDALTKGQWTRLVQQTIRCLTFEALELTHTCHGILWQGGDHMDPEEIDEIRDEEASLIEELENLVLEFNRLYTDLEVGIYEFVFKHWFPRMDEVVPPQGDEEEIRRIRAAGACLSESDCIDWDASDDDSSHGDSLDED